MPLSSSSVDRRIPEALCTSPGRGRRSVKSTDAPVPGFKVVDSNGQTLAYIYGHADQRDAAIAKSLTLDEARRIASNIAKLPDLLGKVRPDDNIQAVSNLSDERHEAEDSTPRGEP